MKIITMLIKGLLAALIFVGKAFASGLGAGSEAANEEDRYHAYTDTDYLQQND